MKYTHKQKAFLGSTFTTPKGGVLTVKSIYSKNTHSHIIYCLDCSICSKDSELWKSEDIRSVKNSLVKGHVPCGCASNPRWTEDQTKIRIRRECEKRGYIFHGFDLSKSGGKYVGVTTKLDLENVISGVRWNTASVNNFFKGCEDPVSGSVKRSKGRTLPDEHFVEKFIKAGFTEDYIFWRGETKGSWYYKCPNCSQDKYVKLGLCSGIFKCTASRLKLGNKSCRCSSNYRWTQNQREYHIEANLEIGSIFIGWCDGYVNSKSKFLWTCSKGHECTTDFNSFYSKGVRCKVCANLKQKERGNTYGYYKDRVEEKDHLYIIKFDKDNILKVGRSFDVRKRLMGSGDNLLRLSDHRENQVKVYYIFSGKHEDVFNLEQELHSMLEKKGFHVNLDWTTEGFAVHCKDYLSDILKSCNYPHEDGLLFSINKELLGHKED